jgi:uncharacterized protein
MNNFNAIAVASVAGLLFGAGLAISGMVHPANVLAFLDVAGEWDPRLAAVMAAALVVSTIGFRLARARARPFFAELFQWPTRNDIDQPLVVGAIAFGVGWGIAGYCPGPAIAALSLDFWSAITFLSAMLGGSLLRRLVVSRTVRV